MLNGEMPLPSTIWVLCTEMEMVSYRTMSMPKCGGILPHHLGIRKLLYTEEVAEQMTPADFSAVQKLARECVRKKYKGC